MKILRRNYKLQVNDFFFFFSFLPPLILVTHTSLELQRNILQTLSEEYSLLTKEHKQQSLNSETERQYKLFGDNIHKLQYSLYSISDLFNSITEPYKLWEYSLIIIYLCKYDDMNLIQKLWKSIIFR